MSAVLHILFLSYFPAANHKGKIIMKKTIALVSVTACLSPFAYADNSNVITGESPEGVYVQYQCQYSHGIIYFKFGSSRAFQDFQVVHEIFQELVCLVVKFRFRHFSDTSVQCWAGGGILLVAWSVWG